MLQDERRRGGGGREIETGVSKARLGKTMLEGNRARNVEWRAREQDRNYR